MDNYLQSAVKQLTDCLPSRRKVALRANIRRMGPECKVASMCSGSEIQELSCHVCKHQRAGGRVGRVGAGVWWGQRVHLGIRLGIGAATASTMLPPAWRTLTVAHDAACCMLLACTLSALLTAAAVVTIFSHCCRCHSGQVSWAGAVLHLWGRQVLLRGTVREGPSEAGMDQVLGLSR